MFKDPQYDPPVLQPASYAAIEVWCGILTLGELVRSQIEKQDPLLWQAKSVKLIIDLPQGFAVHTLETLRPHNSSNWHTMIVTFSNCAEYWEDLWDLRPGGLLVAVNHSFDLANLICRAATGEQCRITPSRTTVLNHSERQLLRYVAHGHSNKAIGQQLGLQEKTVMNALTTVYNKLNVKGRTEAILHYWDLRPTAGYAGAASTTAAQPSKVSQPPLRITPWEEYPTARGYSSLTSD